MNGLPNVSRPNLLFLGNIQLQHPYLIEPMVLAPNVRSIEWCYVPAGKVTLEDVSSNYYPPGTKGGIFDVPAFYMAKYPITNDQYQVFVDDKAGYPNSQWWAFSDDAQAWRKQNTMTVDTSYPGDDLPRTNVCWYEAVAFCNWLTARSSSLRSEGEVQKVRVLLPTEQQWQRAAQGDDNRIYPWGDAFDQQCCNTFDNGIHKTTPVTQYPDGASPYGVMDMRVASGVSRNGLYSNNYRVARGGSWYVGAQDSRVLSRDAFKPHITDFISGFRVVISSVSTIS